MNTTLRIYLLAASLFLLVSPVTPVMAQLFGPENALLLDGEQPQSIYTTDIDNDGKKDILLAATWSDELLWYRNFGDGKFGPAQLITNGTNTPVTVFAADLNGDGLEDVMSANFDGDDITWLENLGGGNFGPLQTITSLINGAYMVYAADLDNDGDADVMSASWPDSKLAWYENLGGGSFGPQQVVWSTGGIISVHAADFDNDGLMDLASASFFGDDFAWYRNEGDGTWTRNYLEYADGAYDVYAGDLDGDGDQDLIGVASGETSVFCYENDGAGNFTSRSFFSTVNAPRTVFCDDLDNDGDLEIMSSDWGTAGTVLWYENLGGLNFMEHSLSGLVEGVYSVHSDDLDNDGDAEILIASYTNDKIAWYENLSPQSCDYPPVYLSETYSATSGSGLLQLNWQGIPDAFAYKVRLTRIDGGAPKFKHFFTSSNSLSIPGSFVAGEKYRWKVRAACSTDTTDWSNVKALEIPSTRESSDRPEPTVSLYPNPASEFVSIQTSNVEAFQLQVMNSIGQIIFEDFVEEAAYTIAISDWATGTYFYQAEISDSKMLTGSFSKQ